jgi:hypothetical protein
MYNTILSFLIHYRTSKLLKNLFYKNKVKKFDKKEILIEINSIPSNIITTPYLTHNLSKKYEARLTCYKISSKINFLSNLIFFIRVALSVGNIGLYKAFGVRNFLIFKNHNLNTKSKNLLKSTSNKFNNKIQLEKLEINKVLIGDLIYDSYLKDNKKETVDLKSKDFLIYFEKCLKIFLFWENYFKINNVKSIIVSHTVYLNAIPLRIAIKNNIPAYQINLKSIYYLNKKEMFAYKQYKFYPKIFSRFDKKFKQKAILEAKKRLKLRFKGEVGVDMVYSTKSAYKNIYADKLIKKSKKIKILVASHCFMDSPHSLGDNLFCDFYEWFEFLGKISLITDYDWYIKTHPDFHPLTLRVINNFTLNYKKFNLLPADSSHNQLISEGIDFGLTIYGTIGCEYAAKGISVINASINNPHIKYDFNMHPKNIIEYKNILMNLNKIQFNFDIDKVYEYYYMHNLYYNDGLLFGDYSKLIKKIGGYKKVVQSDFYNFYLKNLKIDEHKLQLSRVKSYIDSKYYMSDMFFKDLDNKVKKFIVDI